jgi:hypothetical protein
MTTWEVASFWWSNNEWIGLDSRLCGSYNVVEKRAISGLRCELWLVRVEECY